MGQNEIKSHYGKLLAFSYGDKEKLLIALNNSLRLWENSKNITHPEVKQRIEFYTKLINYGR